MNARNKPVCSPRAFVNRQSNCLKNEVGFPLSSLGTVAKVLVTVSISMLFAVMHSENLQAQSARSQYDSYELSSGIHSGQHIGNEPFLAYKGQVKKGGAAWIRLYFKEAKLSSNSYILVTSTKDGASQKLNASALSQWNNTSAYFNGDAVDVELYIAPQDSGVSFRIDGVLSGQPNSPSSTETEGICGSTDTRSPSSNPAVGRLVDVSYSHQDNWGTVWISPTGSLVGTHHSFVLGSNTTVEFNVPPSASDGTTQWANPKDQYAINFNTFVSSGVTQIGNDWSVFSVYANSQSALLPIQAQQAYFGLEQSLTASPLQVTGYGTSTQGTRNRAQQTATGPNAGSSGTTLSYFVDAEPGNSGSPVIDIATGNAIGIHTNGGCNTSSGTPNQGTSLFNTALWNALHPSPYTDAKVYEYLSNNSTSVGTVGRWNGSSFSPVTLGQPLTVTPGIPEVFLGDQGIYNSSQKYNNWQLGAQSVLDYDVVNPHKFLLLGHTFTSHFQPIYDAGIKSLLLETNASVSVAQFIDPWLIDYADPKYGVNRNEGISAPPKSVPYDAGNPYNLGTNNTSYNGVFVNQSGPPNWAWPYYSVVAPATYSSGGYNWVFTTWSATNGTYFQNLSAQTTPVVFGGSGSVITANYKGIHISNDASAFSNNGQKKLVRTSDNFMFQAYTSVNHVFLEYFSPIDNNWHLANNGPLDWTGSGKCPSVDWFPVTVGGIVTVVFQQPAVGGGTYSISFVSFKRVGNDYVNLSNGTVYTEQSDPYSTNANPNLSFCPLNYYVLSFERKTTSGGRSAGINCGWAPYTGDYGTLGTITNLLVISPSSANSTNASLSGNDQDVTTFELAWQEGITGPSSVKATGLTLNQATLNLAQDTLTITMSNWSYTFNSQPSVVTTPGHNWYASWIASPNGITYKLGYTNKVAWGLGVIWAYGNAVKSTSINVADGGAGCYFVWSQGSPYNNNQVVNVGNVNNIATLSTSGQNLQLSNGDVTTHMYASSYYNSTSPYYFLTSQSMGSILPKVTPNTVASGRGCDITEGDLHFLYSFGDLNVDGQNVAFKALPDTLNCRILANLNSVFETEPFDVTPVSKVVFDETSGFADSSVATAVLGATGYVGYRVEILDDATGKVIGTMRDTQIGPSSARSLEMTPYLLNTTAIKSNKVRVRVTITTSLSNPQFTLVESRALENLAISSTTQSVSLTPVDIITDYSLDQNFPNPFNPTTVISYTIPKDGMVTLKIFDALGREVKTLVNENQTVGRYAVSFDASRLSSGVYFYRLVSGNYVSTKKMLLVK